MLPDHRQPDTSYIRERLLELQSGYPVVEGLMLVSRGGFVLASTFNREDNVSRLAAVTRTMFLLSEDVCREMGRGDMKDVHLTYRRGHGGDDNAPSRVILKPVNDVTMLMMVLHSPLGGAQTPQETRFLVDVERMLAFIAHRITAEA
ncbi:MAG: roadblock/LC7 domain-containing protein [Chloroflexota bacterium]